jgi:replication factor C subunit 1
MFLSLDVNLVRVKDAEKYIILKPWDIAGRYLSGGMFHPNSKVTLNEKIELYFNDFEFSSLMIQENYLRPHPDLARNAGNVKEQQLKALELAEKASESISNGDLVDAMIHGYPTASPNPHEHKGSSEKVLIRDPNNNGR